MPIIASDTDVAGLIFVWGVVIATGAMVWWFFCNLCQPDRPSAWQLLPRYGSEGG